MSTLLPGNIVYGGPLSLNTARNSRSLGQFILDKCKSHGEQILLIDANSDAQYSGKFIYDSVVRLAQALRELGVNRNDVIGISGENSVEFAITLFATFAVGATAAPLNVTYSEYELDHAMKLSKPKVMFATQSTVECIVKLAQRNSFVKTVITYGTPTTPNSQVYVFNKLLASQKIASDIEFRSPDANTKTDVALILCSSGTTGLPKGVQLTHFNILATIDTRIEGRMLPVGGSLLSVIPWFHVFGCITLIAATCMSLRLVYLPKFVDKSFLGAIEKYRVIVALMVPPLMVFLAKHPLVDKYDLSSLRTLACGAAPLAKETLDQVTKRIGVPAIRQGYGLSEVTLGVLSQTERNCKPGSVGVLNLGVYARVVDPDTGKVLGPNQRGELCFRGEVIMKGYIGDIKSTQAIMKDGWLHSGDVGYYDEDFEFFIVDRIKELIKYKGFQVPPAEIEALLLTHPKIRDAAVIGKPDELAGELPVAYIVKQDNVPLSEAEVIDFVKERVSPAKRIRGGVYFINEIPKSASGKILRRELRDMLKNQKSKL